jgi:predicted ArsR family transcriptional regulator
VKHKRVLKRMTLLVIAEILDTQRPLTSRAVAEETRITPRDVRQILKRLSNWGWLVRDLKPGQEAKRGAKQRYRLTAKGRNEGRAALVRQATFVGGRSQICGVEDAPQRTPIICRLPRLTAMRGSEASS